MGRMPMRSISRRSSCGSLIMVPNSSRHVLGDCISLSLALQRVLSSPVSGACGTCVGENQSRYIGGVHDTSAPTIFPGMSEYPSKKTSHEKRPELYNPTHT